MPEETARRLSGKNATQSTLSRVTPEAVDLAPGPCIPEDRDRVVAAGEHVAAVGRNGQAPDHARVPFQGPELLAGFQVPYPDGEIRPVVSLRRPSRMSAPPAE